MQALLLIGLCLVAISSMMAAMGYRGRQQVVGIDLGTTFSVVAIKNGDDITIVPDRKTGKPLVPSVVTFHPNGSTVVGTAAVHLRDEYPKFTIFNAKRFIGRNFADSQEDAQNHPFDVIANTSDINTPLEQRAAGFDMPKRRFFKARWLSPTDVGAKVVQHLGRSISKFMGYTMYRAVICVPAKFGPEQTKATKEAFEKGGFKVMRVLEEPTAAAVAYNLHKTTGVKHVLVYDIGGGTLDTSLLYMNGQAISVLGVAGDDHLGGSDFDQKMLTLLEERLPTALSSDIVAPHACNRIGLHVVAEEAKIVLSSEQSVVVRCKAEDGKSRELAVTRAEFEKASEDLFARAIAPVEKVLEDQHMGPEHVDDVVLVGGASRTPKLRALLQGYFGETLLHTEIDPDVTVAWGAANILD